MTRLLLAWAALMLLLGGEWAAAALHAGRLAFLAAPCMVALVALVFMHAARASSLARIFACAGLLWLTILLVLGSVDYLARTDRPVQAPRLAAAGTL